MHSRSLTLRAMSMLVLGALALGVVWVAPLQAQGPDATVIPDTLNMRYGPSTSYSIVATLTRGTALTLLGQNALWVYVSTPDGQEGWVASGYVDIRPDLDIASLPFRDPPADQGPPGGGEPPADAPPEPDAPPPPEGGFPEGTGVPAQTVASVNMRTGPGTGYRVITTLASGTPALAKGRDAAMEWIFVNVGGQDGWVYYSYIQLMSGYISSLPVTDAIATPGAVPVDASEGEGAATGESVAVLAPVAGGPGLAGFGYGGHVDSFAYPDLMHYAGMTWAKRQIRFTMGMSGGAAAGAIDQAHANGFKILLGIVGYPEHMGAPGYFEDYARFVGEVAALGPDAIEVWNEQNLDREWTHGQIDPARYTQLLALAYNAIKSANPNVAVISGAPSPTGAEGAFGSAAVWNDDRYVQGMAAAGAANYMDCIGAHYNEGIISPNLTGGDPRGGYYTRYFWGMVNTYYNAFGGARPVCFTELGYVSPEGLGPLPGAFSWGANTSVAEQALWLAQAVSLSRSSGRVRLVIIWNVDFTSYGGDPMAGYAIIRPGGSCPACDALSGVY